MNRILVLFCVFAVIIACKAPEARKPETVKTGSFINESAKRNKQLYEAETKKIKAFVNTQKNKTFTTSEYGFWLSKDTIVNLENAKFPGFGDVVNFNFNIATLDGTIIYSKEELKTRDYIMDKQEIFTGMREALKGMQAGETFTFIFPSQKAYGYYGDENKIARNTPIISQVTVNSITKK